MINSNTNSNYRSFKLILEYLKDEIIKCTDNQMKQYILYFLCNRANFWRINEGDLYDMIEEIMLSENSTHGCTLTLDQYNSALKGYKYKKKITNRFFIKKTGILFYTEASSTAREFEQELLALGKLDDHAKRIDLLKRLVRRKKKVTVNEALELFKKHDVGISRTKFYNTVEYKFIMDDYFLSGNVKIKKIKDSYVIKSSM
jgi:hypothetical protein